VLYGGDCTIAALQTRALLYPGSQLPPTVLADYLAPVGRGEQALYVLHHTHPDGTRERIAEGFERWEPMTAEVIGAPYCWLEQRSVSRSVQLAQAGEQGLRARLANAKAEVAARNKRRRGWHGAPTRMPCGRRSTPS
jgi:hypothetical protein